MRATVLLVLLLAACGYRPPYPDLLTGPLAAPALIEMPPVNTRPPPDDDAPRTPAEQARVDHLVDSMIASHARLCGTIGAGEFRATLDALRAMPRRAAQIDSTDMLRLQSRAMQRAREQPTDNCRAIALLYREVRGRIAADRPRPVRPTAAPDTGWQPSAPAAAPPPAPAPAKPETLDL